MTATKTKTTKVAKVAKVAATKAVAKSTGKERETVRVRALKALNKGKKLSATEIAEAIGLGHNLKPTMDEEVERGHLKHGASEEENGPVTYAITEKGKKALINGTVNPKRAAE